MLVAVVVLWSDATISVVAALTLVARDVVVLAAWAFSRRSARLRSFGFAARPAGKVVTVLQLLTLVCAIGAPEWLTAFVVAVAVGTLVAIADYTAVLVRAGTVRAGTVGGGTVGGGTVGGAATILALAGVAASGLGAQQFRIAPRVQPEVSAAAALGGDGGAMFVGAGANVPAGYYVRVAGSTAVGVGRRADQAPLVRAQVVGRFLIDPFRQRRTGPYVGGGLVGNWRSADHGRVALLFVAGLELPSRLGWEPGVELAVGSGITIAFVARHSRRAGR
ncbi:MAG: hypothetical protein O2973_03120 [Gemmatimonadetes bacterium]|nr:hypothetical protein [Gemmatimonadota bacterium]